VATGSEGIRAILRYIHSGPMAAKPINVRLEFSSAFEMLDFVQLVSDRIGHDVGLDDDAVHWVGVAIRESVINAIKHGNRNDSSKHVFVEFAAASPPHEPELNIRVR